MIKIDGRDYDFDQFPEQIKAQVAHIQAAEVEIGRLRMQMAIHETARAAYFRSLKQEMVKAGYEVVQEPQVA